MLRDYELKTPWDVVRTKSKITANPLVEGSATVLWSYGVEGTVSAWTSSLVGVYPTSPYLSKVVTFDSPPYTLTVDAIFSAGGPSTGSTVDYDFLMGDNTGTSNWVDAVADHSNFIDETNFEDIGVGLRLNFVWDGGGGWDEMVIPFADITATPIEASDPVITTASDSTAITTYGEKTFILDCPFIQEQAYAQSYADYVVAQLKDAKKFPTIMLENRGSIQFLPDLYVDKIALTVSALGINDTFRVGKISHRWKNENGFAVQTTLKLEPVLGVLE